MIPETRLNLVSKNWEWQFSSDETKADVVFYSQRPQSLCWHARPPPWQVETMEMTNHAPAGIVALDLSDKLGRICYQRWAKILICLTHCGGFVTRWVGKKWRCSNAVIPTLGLIRLYSSLTTLFPWWNSLTNHHSQTEPRMKGMRLVVNRETSKLIEFDLKVSVVRAIILSDVDLALKKL